MMKESCDLSLYRQDFDDQGHEADADDTSVSSRASSRMLDDEQV